MKIEDLDSVTTGVTKKWKKQRVKEERNRIARLCRSEYVRRYEMPLTDAAETVIPKAYAKASSNGKLPAHARQIFYAARKQMEEMTGKPLKSTYFTQTLLPKYVNRHGCDDWRIVYDARGHFMEPHTEENIPLGTIEVDKYLNGIRGHIVGDPSASLFEMQYPTKGPANRYGAVLFIEKEGFYPLFAETKLAERYDIAIMSTKGQSVTASRALVDEICQVSAGVPLLILHDFDAYGMTIAKTLVEASWTARINDRVRYEFNHQINSIDLGLGLADVEKWNLESESVACKKLPAGLDISDEERAYLLGGQRVELNAFTSADFITWIESKLEKHEVTKVVPSSETLTDAYRRAYHIAEVNRRMTLAASKARQIAEAAEIPGDLQEQINAALAKNPQRSWDGVLAEIAEDRLNDSAC